VVGLLLIFPSVGLTATICICIFEREIKEDKKATSLSVVVTSIRKRYCRSCLVVIIQYNMPLEGKDKLWKTDIPGSFIGKTFKELSGYFCERQAIITGVMRWEKI